MRQHRGQRFRVFREPEKNERGGSTKYEKIGLGILKQVGNLRVFFGRTNQFVLQNCNKLDVYVV